MLFLYTVAAARAHFSLHGQTTTKYKKAATLHLEAAPATSFAQVAKPEWKSVCDRLKRNAAARRIQNRPNEAASRIVDEIREGKQVLSDIIS